MYLSSLIKDGEVPEGFFDDPIQDAKVRGIEYKVGIYQTTHPGRQSQGNRVQGRYLPNYPSRTPKLGE